MRKPAYRWRTRAFEAALVPANGPASAHDERFVLRPHGEGPVGHLHLRLDAQRADEVAAGDPDLAHAVRCWLAARGRFECDLRTDGGRVLSQGPFDSASLGEPAAADPQRIITLAPSNAEIVEALGIFYRVIACEDSSDFPAAVADLPRLGPDLAPDLDRVQALAPDLVLSSLTVPGMERNVVGLRARGVPQLVLAPRSIADVLDDLRRVGAALGVRPRADAVVADMQAQLERLRQGQPSDPVRIYLEWWPRPMFSPGRDSYAHELIELAGGTNVFGEREGASVQIDAEQLVAADPELCFVSWCGVSRDKLDPQNLRQRPGLDTLPAATEGRVYRLDEAFSGRPGPRMLEAAKIMAEAIQKSGVRSGNA